MKYCPGCGQKNADNARFCYGCGKNIQQPTAAIAPVAVPAVVSPPPAAVARAAEQGLTIPPQQESQSAARRVEDKPGPNAATPPAAATTAPPTDAVAQPDAVPTEPTLWQFRELTSGWADTAAAKVRSVFGNNPVVAAVERIIRGVLIHRDVYNDAAKRPELNIEAACIAAAVLFAGGVAVTGYADITSRYSYPLLMRTAFTTLVSWACAVFAIHYAAKAMHQIELPPKVLFRALVYTQGLWLLMLVPGFGSLLGIWVAVCVVAALHDLSRRDTTFAVVLTVVGGVASSVGAYLVGKVLR